MACDADFPLTIERFSFVFPNKFIFGNVLDKTLSHYHVIPMFKSLRGPFNSVIKSRLRQAPTSAVFYSHTPPPH
jgi:hypothetical protein